MLLFFERTEKPPQLSRIAVVFGGEMGIRTPDTVVAVYTISIVLLRPARTFLRVFSVDFAIIHKTRQKSIGKSKILKKLFLINLCVFWGL